MREPFGQHEQQTFVRSHMDVMAVADFFALGVWTLRGLVRYHVFFVINLARRQVEAAHIDCQVNGAVMSQVAHNMTDSSDGILKGRRFFACDHDPLYTKEFRQILTDFEVKVIQTRVGCPQENGYSESFVGHLWWHFVDDHSVIKVVQDFELNSV
ncbi:MAG: hypothetical protein ACSHYA_09030 [Opitutaceae bacterium]